MLKKIPVPFLATLLIPVAVGAAEPAGSPPPPAAPPVTFTFQEPLDKVDQKVTALLGKEKQKILWLMAEASVLTDFCAAVDLDQEKFKQEFDALATDGQKRTPKEQRVQDAKLAMYFGVYVGLLIAEGTDRRAEFCGLAENALRDKKPISRFWIAAAKNPKTPGQ